MRVLVIGGYGLIGAAVVARLHAGGHTAIGLGRSIDAARRRMPFADWLCADLRDLTAAAAWAPLLAGVEAVVNCAGALQDSPRDDLAAVHLDAVVALAEACAARGCRLVHISAVGADPGAATRFMRSKADAETALKAMPVDWVILRPALLLAPAAYGGSALLRALAAFPGFIPAVHAASIVQVVSVDDVADAAARAVAPGAPTRIAMDLAHPAKTTVRDILIALRGWLGLPPAPVLAPPAALAAPAVWLADAIARLGWRSPMRSTAMAQLRAGLISDAPSAPGLKSLGEMLAGWPAGAQARWFARLYLMKPVVMLTLIGFWLASGLVGLGVGHAAAVAALPGLPPGAAEAIVDAGSVLDIVLGLLAVWRPSAGVALKGMALVSLAYLAGATVLRPDLWADPLGPLLKVVPGLVLALVALAILEAR